MIIEREWEEFDENMAVGMLNELSTIYRYMLWYCWLCPYPNMITYTVYTRGNHEEGDFYSKHDTGGGGGKTPD